MVAIAAPVTPLERFQADNPEWTKESLFEVLLKQERASKAELERIQLEYKMTSEVEIDDGFNYRPKSLAQLQRMGVLYATSKTLPDHYTVLNQNEYNQKIAACTIGIQMALRLGSEITAFLQNSFVHKGKVGIEAKLLVAMLNTSGKIKGRVLWRFEGEGKSRKCTAYCVDADMGEEVSLEVGWEMVEAEGWHLSNGSQKSKWMTMPDMMFRYRSAAFLIRTHYPEVSLGLYSTEELEDWRRSEREPTVASLSDLGERLMEGNDAEPAKGKKRGPKPKVVEQEAEATEEATVETPPPKQPSKPESTKATKVESETPKPTGAASEPPGAAAAKAPKLTTKDLRTRLCFAYHEEDVDKFDLDKILAACAGDRRWVDIASAIIGEESLGWETYLLPQSGNSETGADESTQEAPDEASQDDMVPECVSNPIGAPPKCDPVVEQMKQTIATYKQPKRIRDFFTGKIANNPHLTPEEIKYLKGLCEGRSWWIEHKGLEIDFPRGLRI